MGLARGLMACLVLAGIFLMYGLPASSCGAPRNGSIPSMAPTEMAAHRASAIGRSGDAAPASAQLPAPTSVSVAVSPDGPEGTGAMMAGGMCLSTPPQASDLAGLLATTQPGTYRAYTSFTTKNSAGAAVPLVLSALGRTSTTVNHPANPPSASHSRDLTTSRASTYRVSSLDSASTAAVSLRKM